MKKVLSLILALVMCLGLCACGGNGDEAETTAETSASKGTELTADNYSNYLDVSLSVRATDDDTHNELYVKTYNGGMGMILNGGSTTFYVYPLMSFDVRVEGASTNFNYNDVSITFKVTGKYPPAKGGVWGDAIPFEQEITVSCNIGGKGSNKEIIELNNYTHSDMIEYEWEIIDISGYVEAAK